MSTRRAFIEVTLFAALLFVVPVGYYYVRDRLIQVQNSMYYRLFGIQQEYLEEYKKKQAEIRKRDEELETKNTQE